MRTVNGAMQQNFGLPLAGTPLEVSDGLHVLGFLANGANSKNFRDGTLLTTGDSGNTQTIMTAGRIGAPQTASQAYLNTAGNAIMEMVIFNMDPTGLAGWNAFQANQLARFS